MKMLELESEYQGSSDPWGLWHGPTEALNIHFTYADLVVLLYCSYLYIFFNVTFPYNGIFMDLNILLIFDYFAELNIMILLLFLF